MGKRKHYKSKKIEKIKKIKTKSILLLVLIVFILVYLTTNINSILAYFIGKDTKTNEFSIKSKYIVTYDANTGTGDMPQQEISYNKSVNLNPNTFEKTDMRFKEWNTNSDGTGTGYVDQAEVTNLDDITLYAQWELNKENVTITGVPSEAQSVEENKSKTFTATASTAGTWTVTSGSADVSITNGASVADSTTAEITYKGINVNSNPTTITVQFVPTDQAHYLTPEDLTFTVEVTEKIDPIIYPTGKTAETVAYGETVQIRFTEPTTYIESFKVIKNIDNTVWAVPYYNLDLDEGRQATEGNGGTIPFANSKYWVATNANIDMTNSENLVQPYIDAYSTKVYNLTEGRVTAEIPRTKDTESIPGFNISNFSGNTSPVDSKVILNASGVGEYWVGSPFMGNYLNIVDEQGRISMGMYTSLSFGVRPLIRIAY